MQKTRQQTIHLCELPNRYTMRHCAGGPDSRRGSKEAQTGRVSFDSRQIPPETGSPPIGGGSGYSGFAGGGPVASPHDLWRRSLRQRTPAGNATPSAGNGSGGGAVAGGHTARSSGAQLVTDSFTTDARPQSDRRSSGSGAALKFLFVLSLIHLYSHLTCAELTHLRLWELFRRVICCRSIVVSVTVCQAGCIAGVGVVQAH